MNSWDSKGNSPLKNKKSVGGEAPYTPFLWFPYAQMQTMPTPPTVVSAKDCTLTLADGRDVTDAIASWWSVIHGYQHPDLVAALIDQVQTLPHVMLGGLTHTPAEQLAQKLADITPGDLQHVFFSDSGSVGVEVSLKMAMQYWRNLGKPQKSRFAALIGAYHGDTFMAMSVGDPEDGMHHLFSSQLSQQLFLDRPPAWHADPVEVQAALQKVEAQLTQHADTLAAVIVEPLLQGAGGFYMYAVGYLSGLRSLCQRHNVLFIADEVATGFCRTGAWFACEHAQITPDIMVLGKGLTAGYMGHAATITTPRIFDAFLGDADKALMHGPTFMGNPMACRLALTSIALLEKTETQAQIKTLTAAIAQRFEQLHSPHIRDIRTCGVSGVVEIVPDIDLTAVSEFALERGVWLRPFGNIIYMAPPYCMTVAEVQKIGNVIQAWLDQVYTPTPK